MKVTRRQLRQLIQEAMSVESDKDIDKKIHNAALVLLSDNPDFEYNDCYDEAAEHLGYKDWNERGKKEYGQKADAAYQAQKSQPNISIRDPRHGMHKQYQARVDREEREYAAAMRRDR